MPFQVVEHTADVAVALRGDSLTQLLEALVEALRTLYGMPAREPPDECFPVALVAPSPEALLVGLANEIIYLFDARGLLAVGSDVALTEAPDGLRLAGFLECIELHRRDFVPDNDFKAATYHRLHVTREEGTWCATLVLDT